MLVLRKYAGREGKGQFRYLTLAEQQQLKGGQTVWFLALDGSARRAKVTSVQTWKRQPERVAVRVKYGLYEYGCFTERDTRLLALAPEDDPLCGSCDEPASKHSHGADDFSHCPNAEGEVNHAS